MSTKNSMPTKTTDESQLIEALEKMLQNNEPISARSVVRNLGSFKHASAITRNATRLELVKEYQKRQERIRSTLARSQKESREKSALREAQLEQENTRLRTQNEALQVFVRATFRVTIQMGGAAGIVKLLEESKEILAELKRLGLLAETDVTRGRLHGEG